MCRLLDWDINWDINWMSTVQERSPFVQVKEPYGNLNMVTCRFSSFNLECTLTEIFGLWLIPAALELQYCGSRAATTCSSRAALKYFVCKLVFRL